MYKKRILEEPLLKNLDKKSISIILGPRQSGKTTLLKKIFNDVQYRKFYLDLDIFENRKVFTSYSEVITYLKFNGYEEKEKFVLFLDEFHTVKGIDKILKNLYDHHPNLKIFATGSSSLEIVKSISESLAGRKNIFHLYPLNFEEFIFFKDEDLAVKLSKASHNLPQIIKEKLEQYVKEFCIFGGYPAVVLAKNLDEKKEILKSIFDLFIKKDLIEFLNIKNPYSALDILKFLAFNVGKIINYSEICTVNHIDINTLKRYLNILNETFITAFILPFYTNKNKEIVKAPKVYFYDMGTRNYFLKDFTDFNSRVDNSFLIENYIFSELIKKSDFLTQIKFWRDKNGREVDFIIERENQIEAYEVKYKSTIKMKDLANLLYFKKIYKKAKLFLFNIVKPEIKIKNLTSLFYFEI
ncbi:MAG: ATP-binding protein [Candidatus Omnitrophica bacterium]|nr:ATP-binding protein [Candidatus Omnitrophota bacterium]